MESQPHANALPGRPGGTGIDTRTVAIMIGNGSDGPMVRAIYTALLRDGAVPRLVGSQLGKIHANDKSVLYIEITLDAGSPGLYDAVVLPDGEAAVASLAHDTHALDFVREQYRRCKPIMVMGSAARLLEQASMPPLPDGSAHPALIGGASEELAPAIAAFKLALATQRRFGD